MSIRAFIALGSNLGDRWATIESALNLIARDPFIQVARISSIYETDPLGPTGQDRFLNAAAELTTSLSARELLNRCLDNEAFHGRVRNPNSRWGPRTLDIDLLLYGQSIIDEPGLHVPHPHLGVRPFVLIPLAEIAPDIRHPISGKTMQQLTDELPASLAVEYRHPSPCLH